MPLPWSTRSTDPLPARRPPLGAGLAPLARRLARLPREGMGGLFGRLLRRRVTADAPQVPLQQLDPRERAAWEERWRRERHERLARNRRARRWRPLRIAGQWMLRAFFALVAVLSAVFGEYGMAVYALSVLVLYSMDFAVFGAAARRDERLLRLYRGLSVVLLALGAWTVGRLLWGWLTTR